MRIKHSDIAFLDGLAENEANSGFVLSLVYQQATLLTAYTFIDIRN